MRKRVMTLLLTLILALALCATAAGAEAPAQSGTLGSASQLSWRLDSGALSIQADQPWTGQVMAACYQNGRFSQVRVLTPDQPTAQVGDQVNRVKLFWLEEESFAPQCEAVPVGIPASRVFTDGFLWTELTDPNSDHFVAYEFARDCMYFINDTELFPIYDLQFAAEKRGTVAEFTLNAQGQIAVVKAYYYTVDKVEGEVQTKVLADGAVLVRIPGVHNVWTDVGLVTGWEGLAEGDVVLYYESRSPYGDKTYTLEKAEKISGKVTDFSDQGALTVGGKSYRYSQQRIDYTDYLIDENIFKYWTDYYDLDHEFNFWLDKNGDIAVAQDVTAEKEFAENLQRVCLVVEAEASPASLGSNGSLTAKLLFTDGSTKSVNVSKLATDGGELKTVVERLPSGTASLAAKRITIEDALAALVDDPQNTGALTRFFHYRPTDSGYELTEMCEAFIGGRYWEDAVTATGSFSVTKTPRFAQGLDLIANSQTTFIVGKGNADTGEMTYNVYTGFKNVPELMASRITAIAANEDPSQPQFVSTMARYVYLEADGTLDPVPGPNRPTPPSDDIDGYIFITDNNNAIDPGFAEEEVYQVNIVDTDGTRTFMRVPADLKDAVANDSMKLDGQTDFILKFWAVKEIDNNGVVTALGDANGQPAYLEHIASLGDDVLILADGSVYAYDSYTNFVFVDLGWEDNWRDDSNMIGVREPDKDFWRVFDYGTFRPQGFFNPNDVNYEFDVCSYQSVTAAVITSAYDDTLADYVYVLRVCW